jgi:hypothetical protein
MKASTFKGGETEQPPVFPKTLHRMRQNPDAIARAAEPSPKPKKRDNIFSKSRDIREDRGERQVKTSTNPQTFSRGR